MRAPCFACSLIPCFFAACSSTPTATQYQDVTLDPPPAGQGFQFATDSFVVPPKDATTGATGEVQRCYFVAVPGSGADPVWVNRVAMIQNQGSHHFNVFRVNTIKNLGGKPGDVVENGECFVSGNWSDWPLVMNSQESMPSDSLVDWTLPTGVGHKFLPGELLMLQIHYVNATTKKTPGHGKGLVNFYTTPAANIQNELGTAFATNQNIKVCPGQTDVSFTKSCTFGSTTPVTVVGANGHFHSRGTKFEIAPYDPSQPDGMMTGAPFYTNTNWEDPLFERNISIPLAASAGFQWTCEFSMAASDCADPMNPMGACCATFGGHVETQEHCNAFVYYYPKADSVNCF